MQSLCEYVRYFNIAITSRGATDPQHHSAMKAWLRHWLVAYMGESGASGVLSQIQWPTQLIPCHLHIDDRAFLFTGTFPSVDQIKQFRPWHRR
jgi:hypothetical protein